MLPVDNGPGTVHCDIAMGFPPADIYDAGPTVVAYGSTQSIADSEADRIVRALEKSEKLFDSALLSPSEAVTQALANTAEKPVVIADVQDNPGAGATSDTTGLLKALVESKATGAVLALLNDPPTAATAHTLGAGAVLSVELGGKSGLPDMGPYPVQCEVVALSKGEFEFSGAMYAGATAQIGPTALLKILATDAI